MGKRYPLPSGMERDYWYPLPLLAWKGIIGIHCPHWHGKGMHSNNWQRGMVWSVAHSASSISQSSGTSGSSLAGVEDVAGWAGEVVDGARMSVREKEQDGRMGSLWHQQEGMS